MSDDYLAVYGRPHHCHAPGCERAVPPAKFMCRVHWFMLPGDIRAAIVASYTRGQEGHALGRGPRPSEKWMAAAKRAIDWMNGRTWTKTIVHRGEVAFRHPPMPEEKP